MPLPFPNLPPQYSAKAGDRVRVIKVDTYDKLNGRRIGDTGTVQSGGLCPTVTFDRPELGSRLMMANQLELIDSVESGDSQPE